MASRRLEADFQGQLLNRANAALILLRQARDYATRARADALEFAVELEELRAAGLTRGDTRWLVWEHWVEHHIETTPPAARRRQFRQGQNLALGPGSCFILTARGAAIFAGHMRDACRPGSLVNGSAPRWDPACRQLWCGDHLVKCFRQPAPAQELILAAFEEEEWPAFMDDPLPPQPNQDRKSRLRITIQNLNRCQRVPLVRFVGDGRGCGVGWRLCAPNTPTYQPPRAGARPSPIGCAAASELRLHSGAAGG